MRKSIGEKIDSLKKILKKDNEKEKFNFILNESLKIITEQINRKNVG